MFLNSLWGKFGQRDNLPEVKLVSDISEYYKLLHNSKINITDLEFLNDQIVRIAYKQKEEFIEDSTSTNIYVAAYTTANARLRLYYALDKLKDKALYNDTDSVIWIDDGTIDFKTGNQIGDWEDEFKDIKGYNPEIHGITEFVSTGPKTYAFKTNIEIEDGTNNSFYSCTKFKGFSNNHKNSKNLNFENLKRLILKEIDEVSITQEIFKRDNNGIITTETQSKSYTLVDNFNKRTFLNDLNNKNMDFIGTKPFGYK